MTDAREAAQALSEGLNCTAAILGALQTDASASGLPTPEWTLALDAMADALERIASQQLGTSLPIGPPDVERVRELSALVSDWAAIGHPPEQLRGAAESVLRIFNLTGPDRAGT